MILIKFFKEISIKDVPLVGGKNAALGEMYQNLVPLGVLLPNGFAVTTESYDYFIKFNNLEERIKEILTNTNIYDINQLQNAGSQIRDLIKSGEFPQFLQSFLTEAEKQTMTG